MHLRINTACEGIPEPDMLVPRYWPCKPVDLWPGLPKESLKDTWRNFSQLDYKGLMASVDCFGTGVHDSVFCSSLPYDL